MKRFKSLSLAVIAMGAAALTITSCNLEEGGRSGKAGRVIIDVSTDSGIDTKAAHSEEFETVDLSVDGLPFFLSMTKSVYRATPSVQTKGAVIFDDRNLDKDGVKNITERGSFDILARKYADKSLFPSIDDVTVTNTASYKGGKWEIDHEIDFNDTDALDFWAYSYEGTKPYSLIDHRTFKYTGVEPGKNKNDGSLMSDFLVANTSNQTAENNPVNIHFYHALAAVKFNVAPAYLTSEVTGGPYSYLSVRISEVKNSGSATFDSNNGAFTWTTDDAKVVYEQVLYDGTEASPADRTMFFIPQDAKDVLLFTFYLTNKDGQEYALSTKSIGATKFEAGYIYNYTIGNDVTGNVEVAIHEGFDGETKTATVGLEASASAYVRVAIVANWFTDAAAGKSSKAYAKYDGDIETGENWLYSDPTEGGDGYYYYKYPLLGHTDSSELVKDFKCTGAEPESPFNLHLEMKIIAQAVMAKQVGDDKFYNAAWVWGSDFGKDIKSQIITVAQ